MRRVEKGNEKVVGRRAGKSGGSGILLVMLLILSLLAGSLSAVSVRANAGYEDPLDAQTASAEITEEAAELPAEETDVPEELTGAETPEAAESPEPENPGEPASAPEESAAEADASGESTEEETTEVNLGLAGVGVPIENLNPEELEVPVFKIVKSDVPLYQSADDESGTVGQLVRGERVQVLSEDGSWSRVQYGESKAYVSRMFLRGEKEYRGLIAIDPGHQAHQNSEKEPVGPGSSETKMKVSSGTTGDYTGVPEYELVLEVSLKLRTELLRRGYDVLMIRTTNDVDISNVERAQMANEAGADAFLRIHADGSDSHQAHGIMTICQTSSNPYNGDIYNVCRELASYVLNGMLSETEANDRGIYESDTYSGINWCTVPVTIVEMGFMSNEEEDRLMQTDEYQEKLVKGMANGVDKFMAAYGPVPETEAAAEESAGEAEGASGADVPEESVNSESAEELNAGTLPAEEEIGAGEAETSVGEAETGSDENAAPETAGEESTGEAVAETEAADSQSPVMAGVGAGALETTAAEEPEQ